MRLSSKLSPSSSSPCLMHSFAMLAISSSLSSSNSDKIGKHSGRRTIYSSPKVWIIVKRALAPAFLTSDLLSFPHACKIAWLRGFHSCSLPAAAARAVRHAITLPCSVVPTPLTSCWKGLISDDLFSPELESTGKLGGMFASRSFPSGLRMALYLWPSSLRTHPPPSCASDFNASSKESSRGCKGLSSSKSDNPASFLPE
mmetsp:Transcript_35286/g.52670  ORF Transcript_35286/g.52670 Transcript_35286/m.52670 type:complete len:200 (-) Transcript_35286:6279-6878(-)